MYTALMNRKLTGRKGFTLIELMVVVAIIGILAAIGLAMFNGAQAKARNAAAKADVKAYQAAIEQTYNSQTGVYTAPTGSSFASGSVPTGVDSSQTNMNAGGTVYCVASTLLNTTADTNHGANCTGCTLGAIQTGTPNTRYCVRNLQ